MKFNKTKIVHYFIISTFVSLYMAVSLISMIHVIDFFKLSNSNAMSIFLALAFEIGAAASLASIIVMEKMNKTIVWFLFILLTAFQAMGNTFYAYAHIKDYTAWIELFGLNDYDVIFQKRVLGIISGAILPVVALGFIKALVDYIKPDIQEEVNAELKKKPIEQNNIEIDNNDEVVEYINEPITSVKESSIDEPELKEEIPLTAESDFEKELDRIKELKEKEAEKELIENLTKFSDEKIENKARVKEILLDPKRQIVKEKQSNKPL